MPINRKTRGIATGAVIAGLILTTVPGSAVDTSDRDRAVASNGTPHGEFALIQQPETTVVEQEPGIIAGNPLADAFDSLDDDGFPTRAVTYSWQSNEDVPTADSERTQTVSFDRGFTFSTGHRTGAMSFYRKLRDGAVFGIETIPAEVKADGTIMLAQERSKDEGRTWRTELAPLTTDQTPDPVINRALRVHRDVIDDRDGNLLLTYYTTNVGEAGSVQMAISTDNAKSWTRLSTVFPPIGTRAFNETTIARAVNGDLVAIARSHVGSAYSDMYTARSTDDGRSWSAPQLVQISTADGSTAPTTGVMPTLKLLPNGIMTLTFGRPDNWIAFSTDGMGTQFTQAQTTYVNYPDVTTGSFQRFHGSSGNGSHAVVASNRVLISGDNCAPTWGCPPTDDGFTIDDKPRAWKRHVDVLRPGYGRIDLLGRYKLGLVKIDTDMKVVDRKIVERGPVGAIDGSTDWGSAAVSRRERGTYTLDLGRDYHLTTVGLSLKHGSPSSATVEVSADGTTWRPAVSTGEITSYALSYYDLEGDATGATRYVRVVVDVPAKSKSLGATLGEIELYSTTNSFENDAQDTVPRGYVDAVGARATSAGAEDGHVLEIADAWKNAIGRATWPAETTGATSEFSFRYKQTGYNRTLSFRVLGTTASGTTVQPIVVAQMSDLSIAYFRNNTWTKLTAPGAAKAGQWHDIRVVADLTGADVYLDGVMVGRALAAAPATSLGGHQFGTSGTASTYDSFLIDDVEQTTGG